jgi:hypothetical protein
MVGCAMMGSGRPRFLHVFDFILNFFLFIKNGMAKIPELIDFHKVPESLKYKKKVSYFPELNTKIMGLCGNPVNQ